MKDKPAATTDNSKVTLATNAETENCTEHLLVCWIDNQLLGSKRIETLATLLETLLGNCLLKKSRVRFIGPSYSSEVQQVLEEFRPPTISLQLSLQKLRDFRVIAPWATSPPDSHNDRQLLKDKLKFVTVMENDQQLAKDLVREFEYRRRNYGHVLIVREAGGVSPDRLSELISAEIAPEGSQNVASRPAELTYLKNIAYGKDGLRQSDPKVAMDDYFQRQLSNITQNEGFSGDDVSAVFVIGDSPQDKLTILRNLQPLFPNATFFTHDLHFGFYEPKNLTFTRGLVIGSRGTLNADVENPPSNPERTYADTSGKQPGVVFRDCYQKAMFHAILAGATDNLAPLETVGAVKLYEIGFNGPYPIDTEFGWTRPLRILGIAAGLMLTVLTIAFVRAANGTLQILPQLRAQLEFIWQELRQLLLTLSPVDEASQSASTSQPASPNANSSSLKTFRLFDSVFELRAEIGLAGICTLTVWKGYQYHTTFGSISNLLAILFIPLTLVMVTRSMVTQWRLETEPSQPARMSPRAEKRIFRLWLHAFAAICLFYTCLDRSKSIPLFQEPYSLTSGISVWPVLLGLLAVSIALISWLWNTWRFPIQNLRQVASYFTKSDAVNRASIDNSHCCYCDLPQVAADIHPDSDKSVPDPARELQKDSLNVTEDKLQVTARIAMLGLLLLYFLYHVHWSSKWFINWALLPLPPSRGTIPLAATTFFSTLGLLLTLNVCLSGLIQVRLLLAFIKCVNNRSTELVLGHDGGNSCLAACRFIQSSSADTIRHSLRNPAVLLLAYTCCRLPVLESWAASANTLLLIAGIPTALGVLLALQLRFASNEFRRKVIQSLNESEINTFDPNPAPATNAAAADTRAAIKTCRDQILALNEGAFSNIWQDPILGTVFFLATALGSSQGFNPITFLLNFIPG